MKEKNLKALYETYSILKEIDQTKSDLIEKQIIYKNLLAGEQLSAYEESCPGFIFIIKGNINIKRINEDGGETYLYNIGKGEICHEALSCYLKCDPLKIVGTALQDSLLAIIPFDVVRVHLLTNSKFMQYIYVDLHNKFNKIINKKEEVKHEPIEIRLVKYLLQKKNNNIYSTHSEIAFELDTAREVVSRKLKSLEKSGYLILTRGKIQIIKDLKGILK